MQYDENKPNYYVCTFSGGKDSTAMLLKLIEDGKHIDEVINYDTTVEFPAMYEHIERVKAVVEEAGVKFTTLRYKQSFEYIMLDREIHSRSGEILRGYGWAKSNQRWCTGYLKRDLANKYVGDLRKKYNVYFYVGLAYDEGERLQRVNNTDWSQLHPLVDYEMTEADCLRYCYDLGYDWGGLYEHFSRTSCWCCPLQSLDDLRVLYHNFPELWNKLKDWDSKVRGMKFKDVGVPFLEARFNLEDERIAQGLTINSHTKEFREALKELKESFCSEE